MNTLKDRPNKLKLCTIVIQHHMIEINKPKHINYIIIDIINKGTMLTLCPVRPVFVDPR